MKRQGRCWHTGRIPSALTRVVAIASPDNASSTRLLEKLGMKFTKAVKLAGDDDEVRLYASDF